MRYINYFTFILIVFISLSIFGCEDEKEIVPEIVAITPANGAESVAKSTSIEVEFSDPMDVESCESRFGLHTGELTEMPMSGLMSGLSGSFSWNDNNTVMTFHPDSTLMDSTMYSICLMEGMMARGNNGGSMMMSGMMGHGSHVEDGLISKFITEKE